MIVTHIIKYTLLSSGVSSAKCFLVSFPLLAVAGVLPEAEEDEDVAAADEACLPTSFLSFIWSLTVFKPHALNCSTVPIVLNMTSVSPSTPSSTSAAINASKDKFYKTDWLTKGLAIYTLVKEGYNSVHIPKHSDIISIRYLHLYILPKTDQTLVLQIVIYVATCTGS